MNTRDSVQKAIGGDAQAMELLYKATYQKLRAVTISVLKNENDAEDIVQESYIMAFSNLHQLEDADKFEGWLCRIASNKCKDYLKKHKPVLFSDLNNSDDEDEDPFEWSIEDDSKDYNPEEVAISDDTRRQLMELVNSLPDEQRICLVYYAVEEMKISDRAVALNANAPIFSTLPSLTLVRDIQPSNEHSPILQASFVLNSIFSRERQFENA